MRFLVTTYYAGQLLCAPYEMPAYRFDSTRVYTNKPACGPKRGHGSVQPRFAFEVQIDKLSERLDLDPIEFRRLNFIGSNTRTINELRVTSNGFMECLESVERESGWKDRFRKLPFGCGLGVAGSTYITGTNYPIYPNDMPQSGVQMLRALGLLSMQIHPASTAPQSPAQPSPSASLSSSQTSSPRR